MRASLLMELDARRSLCDREGCHTYSNESGWARIPSD